MPVCECLAFLTYFILLSFLLSLRSAFLISLCASLFSRGLCPHPFAFCKKRNQKLLCFCSVFFLCVNNSAVKAQPRTLRVLKCVAFWLTLTAYLLFMSALRAFVFRYFSFCFAFLLWALPTPARFL